MRINKAEYVEGYKIKLLFNDNKTKIVDLEEFVKKGKGMFLPLKDLTFFKKVEVDNDFISICWPNGADFSPDVLYEIGTDVHEPKEKIKPKTRRAPLKYEPAYAMKRKCSNKTKQ